MLIVLGSTYLIRHSISTSVPALLLLIPIVVTSIIADWRVTIPVSVVAAAGYALAFLPPIGSIRVGLTEDVLVLITFIVVSAVVGSLTGPRSRQDAELLDERRAVLLRGVSHDLRNPLTAIRTISTELLDGDDHYDSSTRHRLLGRVVDESDRLERIVGNLLSIGRVQAGALNPAMEPESIVALIHRSIARLGRTGTHSIVVDADPDLPDVLADAVQIDQVLSNLIENSLRHTPNGCEICVVVHRLRDRVQIVVSDNGPGFSSDAKANLFTAYASTALGSTGLGLGVCKAIVQAHGGTIEVRDEPTGRGAAVSFTLQLAPEVAADIAHRR